MFIALSPLLNQHTNQSNVKKNLLFILCAFLPFMVFAQTGSIKGVVKDEAGNPVVSGVVRVQGTTTQTLTDSTGAYELTVPYGAYIILVGDDKNVSASENV